MTTQQFSEKNLRRIWDLRTRRGEDLSRLFPEMQPVINEYKTLSAERKKALKTVIVDSEEHKKIRENFYERKKIIQERKDDAINIALSSVSESINERINSAKLLWGLIDGQVVKEKPTYSIAMGDPITYFTARQVEKNLRMSFEIKSPNRNLVASQLLLTLSDETSKYIVRSDIKSFYESIDHELLIQILKNNSRLSRTSMRLIVHLLEEYKSLTGYGKGVPRGLGISAALAEIYLTQLDRQILRLDGIVAYLRYVDDFVIVFSTGTHLTSNEERQKQIKRIVSSLKLLTNGRKTKYITLDKTNNHITQKLNFLGYCLDITNGDVSVDMTLKRFQRYKFKLNRAFEMCKNENWSPRAQQALLERIDFLTSNTRLSHNKRQALIGVYFSNNLITALNGRIASLDRHKNLLINKTQLSNKSLTRISEMTFESGFSNKRYRQYGINQLNNIVRVWKHG